MRVSVIVPVLNEETAVGPWSRRCSRQTRQPDEVVIADGGSNDGTRERLEQLATRHPRLKVIEGPGGIAANRNAAIRAATGEVIACTDAGCLPDPVWLEALVRPFESGADWVAGFYRPVGKTTASTAAGVVMMTVLEEVDMDHFLPGGSSQAFTKQAWERVGGFPEGMNAGEDTLYGEQLRSAGYRPEFAPDAVVVLAPTVVAQRDGCQGAELGEGRRHQSCEDRCLPASHRGLLGDATPRPRRCCLAPAVGTGDPDRISRSGRLPNPVQVPLGSGGREMAPGSSSSHSSTASSEPRMA